MFYMCYEIVTQPWYGLGLGSLSGGQFSFRTSQVEMGPIFDSLYDLSIEHTLCLVWVKPNRFQSVLVVACFAKRLKLYYFVTCKHIMYAYKIYALIASNSWVYAIDSPIDYIGLFSY